MEPKLIEGPCWFCTARFVFEPETVAYVAERGFEYPVCSYCVQANEAPRAGGRPMVQIFTPPGYEPDYFELRAGELDPFEDDDDEPDDDDGDWFDEWMEREG